MPPAVASALKEGFIDFEKKIKGFSEGDGVMTAIESRTSSPIRMMRNSNFESVSLEGLYPCGEGAGFAGGIISAAVDGLKTAESVIQKYSPLL